MKEGLLIGIDGGGTHSTGVAVWPDGRIAAAAAGGGLNFHNDGAQAVRERLEAMVQELCGRAGAPAGKICVGMSALDGPADEATRALFASGALKGAELDLQSDAYVALMGFTMGEPGMIAICGTGSMLLMMDGEGKQHVSGGWGYLMGDAGSGYSLARDALMTVTAEADGIGPGSPFTGPAMAYFGAESPRGLIDRIYDPACGPDRIAGFGEWTVRLAEEGEPMALEILNRQMSRLGAQAAGLLERMPAETRRAGLYGGVFAHSRLARRAFTDALQAACPGAKVTEPAFPPQLGAVIHLLRQEGRLTPEVIRRLGGER